MKIFTDGTLKNELKLFLDLETVSDKNAITVLRFSPYLNQSTVAGVHDGIHHRILLDRILTWLVATDLTVCKSDPGSVLRLHCNVGMNALTVIASKDVNYHCRFNDGAVSKCSSTVIGAVINAYLLSLETESDDK